LNGALPTEGEHARAEGDRARDALRETNRILATVAVDRAQRQHQGGETGQALLQLVEAVHFARDAGDPGLERSARSTIGLWQGEVHRLRSVLPPPPPAEVILEYAIGETVRVHGTSNSFFNDVALSADGRAAVVWSYPEARVIDPVTGQLLGPPLKGHTQIYVMGISPDGKTVALDDIIDNRPGIATRLITCWDVASGKALGSPIKYTLPIEKYGKTLVFSPDGKTLAIGDEGASNMRDVGGKLVGGAAHVRRWDVASGKEVGAALGNEFTIHAVAWSPDARLIALGDGSTVRVLDLTSGQPVGSEMKAAAVDLVFSPDGKSLLTPGANGTYLWDVASGKETGRFEAGDGDVLSVAFSADGTKVLTGSVTGAVRLWDVATRKPLGPPMMHGSAVRHVAFRQGSSAIVAAQDGATIRTWQPAGTGTSEVASKSGWHPGSLVTIPLAFDPTGQTLLAAGGSERERVAKSWDARTGVLRATFPTPVPAPRWSASQSVRTARPV
jgi:WD40 repeat protein